MSSDAMHVAKTGLNAQQTRMQVIANNLANVNTTGFKRDRANFETLLYQNIRPAGAQTSEGTQLTTPLSVGTGVRIVNTEKLYSQGGLATTDNALDVAIDGQGFLQVLLPDGQIGYTRDGALSRNAEGTLTTASGYVVQPEIQIPDGALDITISADGIVSATMPGAAAAEEIGQITLAAFPNPRGLNPIGENFVTESPASGAPVVGTPYTDGMGKLVQGALEQSNVNVVQELVDMIETQRAYEVNSKSISASDEMMRFLSNKL
jgi:flagellar basal-body rod protein FlgG